jgi:hypothetical protein
MEWTFRDGKKFPAGKPRAKGKDPVKVKESVSSNGLTKYLTILWADGVLSCDCRGWAILKKDRQGNPKPRDCKHCKASRDSKHEDMTPVGEFTPDASQLKRQQIDFGARQLRRIRIRDTEEDT